MYAPTPLDGVMIKAVETYPNPKSSELSFGVGLFPFNTYYNGFSVHAGYSHHFNKKWAWEILNAHYVYATNTDVTSQLAEKHKVNPEEEIEKLEFVASSNGIYTHSYGKFVSFEEHIRYFRTSFVFGLGYLNTNEKGSITINIGEQFEVYINDSFSWKIEVRDYLTVEEDGSVENTVAFSLITGFSF